MAPLSEFAHGIPLELKVELTAQDRRAGIEELTICIDSNEHIRWARAVVSSGDSSDWEKSWKARFKAQHSFRLGCEDDLDSALCGACRSIMWSDDQCSAVLAQPDGDRIDRRVIAVRPGTPDFITITKVGDGLEYRNASHEAAAAFITLSCR